MGVDSRVEQGLRGEEAAAAYLEAKGYRIVERRFRTRFGEIDIIAEKDGWLVFVEVRSRTSSQFCSPEATVGWRKQQRIARTAAVFLSRMQDPEKTTRFDVIAILPGPTPEQPQIEHFECAFLPDRTLL